MVQARSLAYPQLAGDLRRRIDGTLAAYIDGLDEGCPNDLREAIGYSLLSPGKRLRPQMTLMAAFACGWEDEESVMPAACAVEMIHTYSLIHDDLPAMDDDDLRRGQPTSHKVFGEALAILAGDALLTLSFGVLARDVRPAAKAAGCCAALAKAAGAEAMVGGQVEDIAFSRNDRQIDDDLEKLESIHRRKTGAMFMVALAMGGIVAEADQAQSTALAEFGSRLGLAFQITDDLLDVEGEEASLGKRVGKDAGRGKLTFPSVLGVQQSRHRAASLVEEACRALSPLGNRSENLQSLARFVVERTR